MKRLYVDEILNNGKVNNEPGPDRYTLSPSFGLKHGTHYSMRAKNDPSTLHLQRQGKLPGPTSYHDNVDLAGKA